MTNERIIKLAYFGALDLWENHYDKLRKNRDDKYLQKAEEISRRELDEIRAELKKIEERA